MRIIPNAPKSLTSHYIMSYNDVIINPFISVVLQMFGSILYVMYLCVLLYLGYTAGGMIGDGEYYLAGGVFIICAIMIMIVAKIIRRSI